jgi:predicted amidohydrolase YtcJ
MGMKTLFRGGRVRTLDTPAVVDWLLMEDGAVAGAGRGDDPSDADHVVDMEGATLLPAFCDAHVHLPATGLYASGMNFRGVASSGKILDSFASRATAGELLFGGNFEDPLDRTLTRHDLDSAVGERSALLARADMHSCIVSSALLDGLEVAGLEGVDVDETGRPTGYLREQAAAEAWKWFDSHLPRHVQRDSVLAAVRLAYSKGIARVDEMFVVEWRGWESLDILLDTVAGVHLEVVPFIATTDVHRITEMGLHRIGGDWFLDGSFGSHTAWLSVPYDPPPPEGSPARGIAYRSDDEVIDFFAEAQAAGLQTGVHAIGDAAIEQALRAWETVAEKAGLDEVRALGHRIEHFECSSDDHIRRAARLNLGISLQPAFDHYWGGPAGLYSRRMGWERASLMNRVATMLGAGLTVGAGSDSTVTPLDPFLQMASLRNHHVPAERLDPEVALRLHIEGSLALSGRPGEGTLVPGARADLVLVDRDPVLSSGDELLSTEVLGTWIEGVRVWPNDAQEGP